MGFLLNDCIVAPAKSSNNSVNDFTIRSASYIIGFLYGDFHSYYSHFGAYVASKIIFSIEKCSTYVNLVTFSVIKKVSWFGCFNIKINKIWSINVYLTNTYVCALAIRENKLSFIDYSRWKLSLLDSIAKLITVS